jgi:hypothetical protein
VERPKFPNQVRTAKSINPGMLFYFHRLEYIDFHFSCSVVKIIYIDSEANEKKDFEICFEVVRTNSKTLTLGQKIEARLSFVSIHPKANGTWETNNWLSRYSKKEKK